MVTKNTVSLYKPLYSDLYYIRTPKIILFGFCLWWKKRFAGTLDECIKFSKEKYNIPAVRWFANYIVYGCSTNINSEIK